MKKLLQTAFCLTAVASLAILPAAGQTTANWIGPTSGGEWNTGANWDVGYPPLDPTTNAIIPGGSTVEYDLPMVATAFGALTNNGILLINTNGFNCASIDLNTPSGGDQLYINYGAVVTVTGNLNLGTNTVGALAAGASLTVNQLNVAYGNSTKANATSYFTNNGGTIYANGTSINNNTGTSSGRLVINGGINNLGKTVIGRYHGTSVSTLGTEGLAIRGGVVTMTNLDVGNNGQGASYLTAYIADGIVTNFGSVFINNVTAGR
ncbi:MAG TPA: hypothetical protein VFV81_01820, partial [Verrucomicrobiae bacterium]|nr:hypothetical protein [Verrucomicrobiae bacterium]